MNLYIACLLACVSLHLAGAVGKWEVINDDKPFDDSGTQDDILSREEFLPFRANKPRPKPVPKPQENVGSKKVIKTPTLLVRGGNDVGEEEFLPLGVQNHANRRLLQVFVEQGPKLPPEIELQRRKLPPEAVNLSTACEESDDSDCIFDIDNYLAKQSSSRKQENTEQDFEFEDQKRDVVPLRQEMKLLSRQKRQISFTETDDRDTADVGSGTEEPPYANSTEHVNEGQYYIKSEIGFAYGGSSLSEPQKEMFHQAMTNQLSLIFGGFPGFQTALVDPPVLINGTVSSGFTLVIDGSLLATSANQLGVTNLPDYVFGLLQNASIPFNNMVLNINGTQFNLLDKFKFTEEVINATRDIFYDYCNSFDPCPNEPEFNASACVNQGFLSGSCPHKCQDYPCVNRALCEIDDNYQPVCNCGDLYEGTFCEIKKTAEVGLTTGETVGVGLAGFAGSIAVVSCCVYLLIFRRNKGFKYTYYEDEGTQDNLTDPTSIANYYIDRPIISATPIPVFNSQEGFDA